MKNNKKRLSKIKFNIPMLNMPKVKPITDSIVDIVYFDFKYDDKTQIEQAIIDFVKNTVNSIVSPDLKPLTEEELKND